MSSSNTSTSREQPVAVGCIVMPHTFGRHLDFKPHLHILVSAAGLKEGESRWIARLRFAKKALMHMWRYAVITYLREALRATVLSSDLAPDTLRGILKTQYERWWSIDLQQFKSKWQFLRYAGNSRNSRFSKAPYPRSRQRWDGRRF